MSTETATMPLHSNTIVESGCRTKATRDIIITAVGQVHEPVNVGLRPHGAVGQFGGGADAKVVDEPNGVLALEVKEDGGDRVGLPIANGKVDGAMLAANVVLMVELVA
jgi:hypothetical protein